MIPIVFDRSQRIHASPLSVPVESASILLPAGAEAKQRTERRHEVSDTALSARCESSINARTDPSTDGDAGSIPAQGSGELTFPRFQTRPQQRYEMSAARTRVEDGSRSNTSTDSRERPAPSPRAVRRIERRRAARLLPVCKAEPFSRLSEPTKRRGRAGGLASELELSPFGGKASRVSSPKEGAGVISPEARCCV